MKDVNLAYSELNRVIIDEQILGNLDSSRGIDTFSQIRAKQNLEHLLFTEKTDNLKDTCSFQEKNFFICKKKKKSIIKRISKVPKLTISQVNDKVDTSLKQSLCPSKPINPFNLNTVSNPFLVEPNLDSLLHKREHPFITNSVVNIFNKCLPNSNINFGHQNTHYPSCHTKRIKDHVFSSTLNLSSLNSAQQPSNKNQKAFPARRFNRRRSRSVHDESSIFVNNATDFFENTIGRLRVFV